MVIEVLAALCMTTSMVFTIYCLGLVIWLMA